MENNSWRRILGAGVAILYSATNVLFCHSAEARFWSARREAARKLTKNGGVVASASRSTGPTDALVLAQLPGGARFDVHSPAPAYVTPVPAKEHLVGGKVPVFSSDLPRWLGDVVTPYGNIRDVHLSKRPGAPLVIHIQDLHDSSEAQRNIAGLVEALQDERGVSLVGLEGAQGAFATEAFRSFPDAEITKAVATYFMDEGYLGGPEFAGITAKRVPLLWGVEDMAGYNANVTAVKESAQNRPAVELFLREARTLLNEIKTRRLSPALLEFDRNFSAYQSRKMALGAYVRYLLKSSPSGTARVPNLVLLRDALTWEDSLDFPRIERERATLLERMVQVLPKPQLKSLVEKSALYRLGRISYGDYYRFFRTLCEENGIPLTDFRQLHAYVRYVLLAERINRNDLLNELSALELGVQDQLISHPRERRVVKAARHLGQMERLVRHSYTPMDWGYHILHEDEIRNVGLTVRALAKEEGLPETLSPPSMEMLKPFENFCLQALGRNGAMVGNLLEKMAAEKRPSAVLVAGGFHTDGMTQLFRQKDVSYVVVTPKINGELPDGHRTLDILARDPAPLEKLFAGETVNIPLQRIINPANGNTPLVRYVVSLFLILVTALHVMGTNVPAQFGSPAQRLLPQIASVSGMPSPDGVDVAVKTPDGKTNRYAVSEKLGDSALRSNQVGAQVSGRNLVVTNAPSHDILERARGLVGKGTSAIRVSWEQAMAFVLSLGLWVKMRLLNARSFGNGKRNIFFGLSALIFAPAASAATVGAVATTTVVPLIGVLFLVPFTFLLINKAILQIRVSWALGNLKTDGMEAEIRRHISIGLPFDQVGKVMRFANQYDNGNWRVLSNRLLAEIEGMERLGLFARLAGAVKEKRWKTPIVEVVRAVKGENRNVLDSALEMMLSVNKEKHQGKEADVLTAALWAANNNINDINNNIPGGLDAFITRLQQGKPQDPPGAWVDKLSGLIEKNKSDLGQVLVANGDMNRISALNDAYKTLGGLSPPTELVGDLLVQPANPDIPPPFLQMWKTLATLVAQEGGFLYAGQGGDEFRVYLEGKDAQERGRRIVQRYHKILAERYAFYTVSLEEGNKSNFENALKLKFGELAKENGVWLVRHGGEYVVMVDRKYSPGVTKKKIQETAKVDGFKSRVDLRDATRPGLGLFTISLGGVAVSSVVEALEQEKSSSGDKLAWKNAETEDFDVNQKIPLAHVSDWAGNDALAKVKEKERNRFDVLTDGQDVKGQMGESISYEKIKKLRDTVNAENKVPVANRPGWLLSQEEFRNKVKDQDGDFYFVDVTRYLKPQLANTIVTRTLRQVLGWVEKYPFVGRVIPESLLRQELKRTELRAFHNLKGTDDVLGDQVRDFFRLNILRWIMPNQTNLSEKHINGIELPEGVFATNFGPDNLLIFVKKSEGTGSVQPSLELDNLSNVQDKFKDDLTSNIEKLNDKEVLPHLTFLHVEANQIRNDEASGQPQENPFQTMGELQDLEGIFLSSSKITGSEGAKRGPLTEKLEEIVDVNPGDNVLLMKFNPQKRDAFESKRAAIEKSKGVIALALVKARVPPQLVSALWSGMANLFGIYEYVARRWLSGHYFQSFGVPLIEILLLPGLMYFAAPYFGLGLVIPFAALINAFLHGFPVSSRGPPQAWYLQTLGQFTVRLWVSTLIYAIAATAGLSLNVDSLSLLLADQIQTLNTLPTFVTGYVSHAIYNFVVPESYRLAIKPVTSVSKIQGNGNREKPNKPGNPRQREPEPQIGGDVAFINKIISRLRTRTIEVSIEDEKVLLYVYRLGNRAFKPSKAPLRGYAAISPGLSFDQILSDLADTATSVDDFVGGIFTSAPDNSTKDELFSLAINQLNGGKDQSVNTFVGLVRLGQKAEAASETGLPTTDSSENAGLRGSGVGSRDIQTFVQKKTAELAAKNPTHYGVSLSKRVMEWGGSFEAQAAALVGGMAYTQRVSIDRLSAFIKGEFSGLDDDIIKNIDGMITSWMRTRGVPYLPRVRNIGIVRNQMGLVMSHIGAHRSGDVLRMVFISKMLDLEALPPSSFGKYDSKLHIRTGNPTDGFVRTLTPAQESLVTEINDLWAPLAERLGADNFAADLRDETFFVTQPQLYRKVAMDLFRLIDPEGFAKANLTRNLQWNPREWYKEKQRDVQSAMDGLTRTLQKKLADEIGDTPENYRIRMEGRLKNIFSIYEKGLIDHVDDISQMNDLKAISIIFPTIRNGENDFGIDVTDEFHYVRAKKIQEVLKNMGEPFNQRRQPGGNPPKGKEFDNYKIVLDPNPRRKFYGGVAIEVKVFDVENFEKYKRGLVAHYIYNLEKRLGISRVRTDEAPVWKSFDENVDLFRTDKKKYVYVGVLREQDGQTYLDPIRLGKEGSPADAAAHRKVDILKEGEYYAMQSGEIGWENISPAPELLDEDTELESGMILIPVMEGNRPGISRGSAESVDSEDRSQSILMNARKKRTKLMWYLRNNPDKKGEYLENGLNIVNDALRKKGRRRSLSPADIKFRIAPIVDRTGLNDPDELFMWLAVILNEEGYEDLNYVLHAIVNELDQKHLKAAVQSEGSQWKVTISGKFNRPGIRAELAGIMKLMGISKFHEVIPEVSSSLADASVVDAGDRFKYEVLIDAQGIGQPEIGRVIDQINRIPDHRPEERPAVVVKLFFNGTLEQKEKLDVLLNNSAPKVSVDIAIVEGTTETPTNSSNRYLYVLRFPEYMASPVIDLIDRFLEAENIQTNYTYPREAPRGHQLSSVLLTIGLLGLLLTAILGAPPVGATELLSSGLAGGEISWTGALSNNLAGLGSVFFGFGVIGNEERIKILHGFFRNPVNGNDIDENTLDRLNSFWKEHFSTKKNYDLKEISKLMDSISETDEASGGKASVMDSHLAEYFIWVFSRWTFQRPKAVLLDQLMNLTRFREGIEHKGNGTLDQLITQSGGKFTVQNLDLAIELLLKTLRLENFIQNQSLEDTKVDKTRKNKAEKESEMKGRLDNIFEVKLGQESLFQTINGFIREVGGDEEKLEALSKVLSKRVNNEYKNNNVAADLLNWSDTTLILVQIQKLVNENPDKISHFSGIYNRYSSRIKLSNAQRNFRNFEFFKFIKDKVKTQRSETVGTMTEALGKLSRWNISTPIPTTTVNNVEIVDLDALAGVQLSEEGSPSIEKQKGHLSDPLLLAGILVPALAIVLFLPGVTFGYETIISYLSKLQGIEIILEGLTTLQESVGLAGGGGSFGPRNSLGICASFFLIAGVRGLGTYPIVEIEKSANGEFHKTVLVDSRGAIAVTKLELDKNDVSFVNTGPNARVYRADNIGTLKCDINKFAIERWNKNDSNELNRGSELPHYTAHTRTQLHTAVLAAMAQYIMGKSEMIEKAILDVGLTEESVHKLFMDGANGEAIRELQNNRFVTLLFTSWAVNFSGILPIGKPGQLEYEISGMNYDLTISDNKYRLAALAKFDLGARDADINVGRELWDLAKNTSPTITDEFRPSGLAVALHNHAIENGVAAKDMKRQLAVTMLSRINDWQDTLTNEKLFEIWGSLALLFGLNGNLSEGRAGDKGLREPLRKVRGHLQNLDLTFLVNLSHTTGREMNNETDLTEKGLGQFNRVAQEALSLRDPHQALTESFAKGEDILVYVSPNMAKGMKSNLTPAERTQIEMLTLLSSRLVDSNDLEAAAWLAKKKRIVFAVVGTEEQVSTVEVSQSSLVQALSQAGADVAGLNRSADQGEISLGFATFKPADKTTIVSAQAEFEKLDFNQVSLFAVDVDGVTVDYSGVKDKIVSFILALAGGLMTQVAPGIVESLKKQKAVKRSA